MASNEEIARGTLNLEVNVKLQEINQKVDQISKTIENRLNTSTQKAGNAITNNLGKAFKSVASTAGVLGAIGAASLATIATKAILAGKEFNILQQQVRAGLTAILGTTKAAEGLLAQVNKLNDTSPFPRQAFLSATQQLVGFGVAANKVTPILDAVQNAVAGIGGNANDIQLFTRAFAQIQSQGRLTGDVLFSLGSKGVDAAKIIGDQMGKTGQQIKDEVTKGTIGAEQAIDLLAKGLSTKFDGAVENVGKSFIGASDRVSARLRDIGADITKAFINPLGGGAAVEGFNNIAVALGNIRKTVVSQLLPGIQSAAAIFVRLTESFRKFTASLTTEDVQKFLDIFKALVPLVGIFATKFLASIAGTIPFLQKFAGVLGGPIAAIGILIATVPALRESFFKMVEALKPAVENLMPALEDIVKQVSTTMTELAPTIAIVVGALAGLISAISPVLKIFNFKPVLVVLTALIARFGLLKIAGEGAFKGIAGSAGVGFFLIAIGIVLNKMAQLKSISDEAAASAKAAITAGLDLDTVEGFATGIDRGTDSVAKLEDEMDRLKGGTRFLTNAFDPGGFFGIFGPTGAEKDIKATEGALKGVKEAQDELATQGAVKQNILSDAMALTGATAEELDQIIKDLGIDLTKISPDQVVTTAKKIQTAFDESKKAAEAVGANITEALTKTADALDKTRAASDALKASEKALADLRRVTAQELNDNVTKAELGLASARLAVGAAADSVIQSELSLAQAKRGIIQADEHLLELNKELASVLKDTTREARELASAEDSLSRTKQTLLDLSQRETAVLRDQADLAEDGADKIASADRAILRAKIALNNATKEEADLLKELNKENITSVDLSGLTVDQIKTKLAGVRAQLAAQRAIAKSSKTQQQIEDEKLTASLNVADAKQAEKDAVEARGDLEVDQAIQKREFEEELAAIDLDKEASLRTQTEQQIALGKLKEGDTETARTIKRLNEEIVTATDQVTAAALTLNGAERQVLAAKNDQQTAAIAVRDAERDVETSTRNTRQHVIDIRDAQITVKEDALKLKEAVATQLGDQGAINRLLLDRIGLNSTLLAQNPALLEQVAKDILGPLAFVTTRGGPVLNQGRIGSLTDVLLNHPDQLLNFLRELGLPFAQGGLVNSETFARIGEAGREVVLPLTRPARLAELLGNSQVLPPVLAALGRISLPSPQGKSNAAVSVPSINTGTRSNVIIRRADGPMTYGQAEAILEVLRENGKAELRIEAPITVQGRDDEDLLIRKISKQVERQVMKNINKR